LKPTDKGNGPICHLISNIIMLDKIYQQNNSDGNSGKTARNSEIISGLTGGLAAQRVKYRRCP
jgi:hypothetical protein